MTAYMDGGWIPPGGPKRITVTRSEYVRGESGIELIVDLEADQGGIIPGPSESATPLLPRWGCGSITLDQWSLISDAHLEDEDE